MPATTEIHERTLWSGELASHGQRVLANEVAVAISYNGATHAVLMASPSDLEDLAVGFSITEGIVGSPDAIESITIVELDVGLDLQVRVRDDIARRLAARRRTMAGPVGCGMCGLESLEAATRHLDPVKSRVRFSPVDISAAVLSLEHRQELNRVTGATHAAGFFTPGEPVFLVREDVGRHNALDKLIGAVVRASMALSSGGIVVTSRASVELVQKSAVVGCGLLAAISAPTSFAVRAAEAANVTLAAVVRKTSLEIFTAADRITAEAAAHVT